MSIHPKKKPKYRVKTCFECLANPEFGVWSTICTGDRDEIDDFLETHFVNPVRIEVFNTEKGWVDITSGFGG